MDKKITKLKEYIASSNYTIAITGAGISFSVGGLSFDDSSHAEMSELMALGNLDVLKSDPERYYSLLNRSFLHSMFSIGPSKAHMILSELEKIGKLHGIITTNIDCLHTIAGNKKVYEIQGSLQVNKCMDCGIHYDNHDIWAHGKAPICPKCGGSIWTFPFYSHIGLDNDAVIKARDAMSRAELILIIGANGAYANAYWPYKQRKAKIVQINPGHTAFDMNADINIRDKADSVLEILWDSINNAENDES